MEFELQKSRLLLNSYQMEIKVKLFYQALFTCETYMKWLSHVSNVICNDKSNNSVYLLYISLYGIRIERATESEKPWCNLA